MARADKPVPKVTQPVLETKELPGKASKIEEALAAGVGCGSIGEIDLKKEDEESGEWSEYLSERRKNIEDG